MEECFLTIGIVNWNTKDYLGNLLSQIFKSPPHYTFEIVVVDNNSNDCSVSLIEQKFPNVTLIKNQTNIGFTKGCNQILKFFKGKYIVLLNTDIILQPTVIDDIIKLMEMHPKIGICGPKLLNKDGTLQLSVKKFHTLLSNLLEEIPKLNNILTKYALKRLQRFKSMENFYFEVDYVSGAFYVIRKEVVNEVGFFDERYQLYCQEVDYAYRVKKLNWEIAYYPYTSAVHYRGESAAKLLWRRLYLLYSDRYVFFKKRYGKTVARSYFAAIFSMKFFQFCFKNFVSLVRPLKSDLRNELYVGREICCSKIEPLKR